MYSKVSGFGSTRWKLCLQTSDEVYTSHKTCKDAWLAESNSIKTPNNPSQKEGNEEEKGESSPSCFDTSKRASEPFYFSSCKWTPDGSSVLTTSSDNVLRLYVAPPNLLSLPSPENDSVENYSSKGDLTGSKSTDSRPSFLPYAKIPFSSSVTATSIYPEFKISEYSPCLVLVSTADHPIKLYNIHSPDQQSIAGYPSVNLHSEAYDNPLALQFVNNGGGDMFLAGTSGQRGQVSLFSLLRPGTSAESSGPIATDYIPQTMVPGYKKSIVSAIAIKPSSSSSSSSSSASSSGGSSSDGPLITAVGFYQAYNSNGKSDGVALYDFRVDSNQGKCVMISPEPVTQTMMNAQASQIPQASNIDKDSNNHWRNKVSGTTKLLWNPTESRFGTDSLLFQIPRNGASNCIVRDSRMGLREVGTLNGSAGYVESHGGSEERFPKPFSTQQRLGADFVRRPGSKKTYLSLEGNENQFRNNYGGNHESAYENKSSFDLVVGTSQGHVYIYTDPAKCDQSSVEIRQLHPKGSSIGGISWNPAVTADNVEIVATCSGNRLRGGNRTQSNNTGLKIWKLENSSD